MHKLIFDCDNTMGIKGCDVDDGLTLLYLLGRDNIDLMGVTTTFGNSNIDAVYNNTVKMFNELMLKEIPLLKGGPCDDERLSDASEFLADMSRKHKGQITLLATGSLTNLLGAYELDSNFFKNLKEIVLMGGITEPLIINGKNLNELNFSCDPKATHRVLSSDAQVTVLSGHICLQAFFGEKEYKRLMENDAVPIYRYIKEKTKGWFDFVMEEFGIEGFYNWDIVAALYITNPELFDENIQGVISTAEELKKGYLRVDNTNSNSYKVNIPREIKDVERFNEIIFETWKKVELGDEK